MIKKIEDHDPETLLINEVYDLLVAQKPNIENLKVAYGPHPITEQLLPLRKKRFMYAAAIVYRMKMAVREDIYPNSNDVIETRIFVNSYLLNLSSSKSEEVVAEKLTQFYRELDENPALEASTELYKLSEDIANLKSTDMAIR